MKTTMLFLPVMSFESIQNYTKPICAYFPTLPQTPLLNLSLMAGLGIVKYIVSYRDCFPYFSFKFIKSEVD